MTTDQSRTPKRVAVAFGTRPEASKLAPVVAALQARHDLTPWLLVTGQHREQLDDMLDVFGLTPDADLSVMRESQTLEQLIARIVPAAAELLARERPDYLLVHGDTATTFAVALASFYAGIPVGHVEAGLRSHNLQQPFPEEANRRLTDVLTDLDLAPTCGAQANLLREGKPASNIVVTGNTAVDAVNWVAARVGAPEEAEGGTPLVTITLHRRENLPVMEGLAKAIADVATTFSDHVFVWPLHLNPTIRQSVEPVARGIANLKLVQPASYPRMVSLLSASRLIVTDSGGLQEEGAALGVPVAVVRNVTERPEGVEAGVLKLVGSEPAAVETELRQLLGDEAQLARMRAGVNPYGDGMAGERVAQAVAWRLGLADRPDDWHGPVLSSRA